MIPLNGTKTHPLSAAARQKLDELSVSPAPCSTINPGVSNRLLREALVEVVMLPSPFTTHKGKSISHFKATDAGLAALRKSA